MNPCNKLWRVQTSTRRLSPSEGMGNKVTISFGSVTEDIHEDPVTGIRTLIQTSDLKLEPSPSLVNFSINSTCHSHIAHLLYSRFMHILSSGGDVSATPVSSVTSLCDDLASHIASAASNLGFGTNGFEINLYLVFVTQKVSVGLSPLSQKFSSLQL